MADGSRAPVVRIAAGDLRGIWNRDLAVFRGVPFAAPPVGELRFSAPRQHPGWTGIRDAIDPGRCAPQPASRLESVMGRVEFEQDEDCLTLNIWAPPVGDGPYPVLLWIHGGGFSTGSASWPFYSGAELARNGRLVVVTANYRLGALGYLYVPELADGATCAANRGLLDQISALQWVHDNVAGFGGDPEAITVAGQSAGGAAIAAMMADSPAKALFKRAVLQSPVLGPAASIDEAAAISDHLLGVLGIGPGRISELQHIPIDRLLAGQVETARLFTRFGAPVGAIQQVVDGVVIRGDLIESASEAAGKGMEVLAGTTRNEMDAFLMQEPLRSSDRSEMIRLLSGCTPSDRGGRGRPAVHDPLSSAETIFDAYSAAPASHSPAQTASAMLTDHHFRIPTLGFIKAWASAGGSAFLYRFDWKPKPDSRYGACHCIDIPFAFNNLEDWESATLRPAMLDGCDRGEFGRIARAVQSAWAEFARSGRPGHEALHWWPECTPLKLSSMQFDVESHLATSLLEYSPSPGRGKR